MDTDLKFVQKIIGGRLYGLGKVPFSCIVYDTRSLWSGRNCLFIALKTEKNDGHDYIKKAYSKGVRCFLVSKLDDVDYVDADFLEVESVLSSIQKWACYHRAKVCSKIVGITGSNGKTIVKEWLYEICSKNYSVYKSPKSYNSQLGVPLSLLKMPYDLDFHFIEAGISLPNEMKKLHKMILPNICVLTNIGTAHASNFPNRSAHINEKLALAKNVETLVYPADDTEIYTYVKKNISPDVKKYTWGFHSNSTIWIKEIKKNKNGAKIKICIQGGVHGIDFQFVDDAHLQNLFCCIACCHAMGLSVSEILENLHRLIAVQMRLEFLEGQNGCMLINDSYTLDSSSLKIALESLAKQPNPNRTIILSDIVNKETSSAVNYDTINALLTQHGVTKLVSIGHEIYDLHKKFSGISFHFSSTDEFLNHYPITNFSNECILIKGARPFAFEKIVQRLEYKNHETVLEVNITSIVSNLNMYKKRLQKDTKIMCMVKAFSYGLGSVEIAKVLQNECVDYLSVAYVNEGMLLRKNDITIPIMVMNVPQDMFSFCEEYALEPVLYCVEQLVAWVHYLHGRRIKVHLKIESGMNRLGFTKQDFISTVSSMLSLHSNLHIASVFSHLSSADMPTQENFTHEQVRRFQECITQIKDIVDYPFIIHILNSAGIINYIDYEYDMVRIGIGIIGYDTANKIQNTLRPAVVLKSSIIQKKNIKKGQSIGYGRGFITQQDMKIATIPIGYADGIPRRYARVGGSVFLNKKKARIVGRICMDFMMIDISDIECFLGDEVEIFGEKIPIWELSKKLDTIPYEVLAQLSSRIKRMYVYE